MTLQVSFDQFAETVKRLLDQEEAYVSAHSAGSLATSAHPEKSIVVAAVTPVAPDVAIHALTSAGLTVHQGTWLTAEEILDPTVGSTPTYVAAVAYRSSDEKAGVWIDAYPSLPTQVTVLRAMYDEFRETGEVDDVGFEEFVQLANPNVVIVSPTEIESFLRQKEEC